MDRIRCPVSLQAQLRPQAEFILSKSRRLTYRDTDQLIIQICASLASAGVNRAKRVAILSGNSSDYVLLLLALLRMQISTVLLNLRLTPADWKNQLVLSSAQLLFLDDPTLIAAEDVPCPVYSLPELISSAERKTDFSSPALPQLALTAEANIIFTSGSKGQVKGVRLSVGNHFHSAQASNEITKLSAGDCWLLSLPLYHTGGLEIVYRTALAGASLCVTESFSTDNILARLSQSTISYLSLVPTMLEQLIDQIGAPSVLSALKAILVSGAPCSEKLLHKIRFSNLRAIFAYGLTETTGHCVCTSVDQLPASSNVVGHPFSQVQLALLDPHEQPCKMGQVGEIVVKGPVVSPGYLNAEISRTSEWFFTGDLGFFDSAGALALVGRKDDMFISGGENIYPDEIEAAAKACPGVLSCAVIAVAHPAWGKRPVLFIELLDKKDLHGEQVKQEIEKKLPRIKQPASIIVLPQLPLTSIGKIDYAKLQKLWLLHCDSD